MQYSDKQRIEKIIITVDKLEKYIIENKITREQVIESETIRWTLTTPLYNIGEHAYNLTDDFKKRNETIPWNKISGLRHRLVHDYDNTNWTIICDIVFDVVPQFREQLNNIEF
ncbi:MAG: DUF86 domain-containing protein [Lachnospiraceae bacterium]|nr:DUF86 domain-containing protein [Lachnospiraceae bacterium]